MSESMQQSAPARGAVVPWVVAVVALLFAGAIGYLGWLTYREEHGRALALQQEAAQAHAQAQETERARLALQEKLAALEKEQAALRQSQQQLSTERDQLSQVVQEKEAELARLKATYNDIQDKLKAEIAQGEIRLSQGEGRIQVDLVDKILFDSGEAALSPRGAEVLTRLGGVLAKMEGRNIQVSGHTDDSPPSARLAATFPSNWELSVARAVNVVRFLQEKAAVPAQRLVAAGYGDTQPVATNANPRGRARNRRIEILLMPVLAPAPASTARASGR